MDPATRITRADSRGRPMHEEFLAVPLCRLGTFQQKKTGLETPVRDSFSVGFFGAGAQQRGQFGILGEIRLFLKANSRASLIIRWHWAPRRRRQGSLRLVPKHRSNQTTVV